MANGNLESCPACGEAAGKIMSTRRIASSIKRYHRCKACGETFATTIADVHCRTSVTNIIALDHHEHTMETNDQENGIAMLIIERNSNGETRYTDGVRDVQTLSLADMCGAVDRCEKTIHRWIALGLLPALFTIPNTNSNGKRLWTVPQLRRFILTNRDKVPGPVAALFLDQGGGVRTRPELPEGEN